jgi:hypothetical protein
LEEAEVSKLLAMPIIISPFFCSRTQLKRLL